MYRKRELVQVETGPAYWRPPRSEQGGLNLAHSQIEAGQLPSTRQEGTWLQGRRCQMVLEVLRLSGVPFSLIPRILSMHSMFGGPSGWTLLEGLTADGCASVKGCWQWLRARQLMGGDFNCRV